MQLSEHFSLEELTITQVRGEDNTPSPEVIQNLFNTARMMERVRGILFSRPIIVTSGYRSYEVNRAVGGVIDSAHLTGHAVDFICPSYGTPLEVARQIESAVGLNPGFNFDQLIREYGWVHISFDPRMRGDVLTKASKSSPYEKGLVA